MQYKSLLLFFQNSRSPNNITSLTFASCLIALWVVWVLWLAQCPYFFNFHQLFLHVLLLYTYRGRYRLAGLTSLWASGEVGSWGEVECICMSIYIPIALIRKIHLFSVLRSRISEKSAAIELEKSRGQLLIRKAKWYGDIGEMRISWQKSTYESSYDLWESALYFCTVLCMCIL